MSPLIRLVTVATFPIAVLISMTHLVGAEHGPGDGFTAGIISALGMTIQYVSFGYQEARRMFRRIRYRFLLIFGLALAVGASALPLLVGQPLMAHLELHVAIPAIGDMRLTRALLFDVGIYLVVLGGSMTAIDSLGSAIE